MTPEQEALVPLRLVPFSSVATLPVPNQKIKTEEDVHLWRSTRGYADYGLFLRRLNEAVVGRFLPWSSPHSFPSIQSTLRLLDTLDGWIDEIPPLPTPQRFGNLAFRTWGKRLEDECQSLLSTVLPSQFHPAISHVSPYLLTSFGSFTRMDYGTGHETSFALFLLCLTLIRFLEPEPDLEREIVLTVFVRYIRLCWRLQDVYKLEPAGSHGVWGLDDYSFLGYIFGSAQLRDQGEIPVSAVLQPPLPPTNLYFLCISRIREVKYGPFHEHSSQLYSIAMGVKHWHKVNTGLFKMYEAEVLGKRVVVQHIPLGGVLEWDAPESEASTAQMSADSGQEPTTPTGARTVLPPALPNAAAMSPATGRMSERFGSTAYSHNTSAPGLHPAAGRMPPTTFATPRSAATLQHTGPLVNSTVLLGPMANTTLRPMSRAPPSTGATAMPAQNPPGP